MTERQLPAGDWRRSVYGRSVISGIQTRKRPRLSEQRRIQASQGNRCLYCELPIGTPIWRRTATVTLRTNWDHFIPYAYSQQNPSNNWVLACHVCNGIKTARMFADVESARKAILPERIAKGYESPDDVFHRLSLGRTLRPPRKRTRARSAVPRPSDRQLQALQLAAYGLRPGQIARELGIGSSQGSVLVQEAARRMGTAARHRAIEIAIENGFINPPDSETEPSGVRARERQRDTQPRPATQPEPRRNPAVTNYPETELRACAEQLSGWTCTLLAGPHPERKHWDQEAGRWWPQASDTPNTISAALGQPDGSQP